MVTRCPFLTPKALLLISLSLFLSFEDAGAKQKRKTVAKPPAAKSLKPAKKQSPEASGLAAIIQANDQSLAASRAEHFVNAAQIFAFETGRVYEVWTAPLRITALSLEPGEHIINKAAGDTQRWMIGDTLSGEGKDQQLQILIKPLKPHLATNMVIATNRRLYLLSLRSGELSNGFNANVRWIYNQSVYGQSLQAQGKPLDIACLKAARKSYQIKAPWPRPDWTPKALCSENGKTYILFPDLNSHEAPPLFIQGPGQEPLLANWRRHGPLYIVDKVIKRAELRLDNLKVSLIALDDKKDPS